ncbi:MAG: c-type cytochrome [Rhodothermaceae bacterium]|nr:c-type cytochrome [Rhodothermaceae bacterium]MBC12542.1 c-type cytochrome [Rhodothermaceae bacterium]
MRLLLPVLLFAVVLLAAYAPAPVSPVASPEAPVRWENLQVLPDTLSRDALMGIMRGFTGALGVRCDHCHARGSEGPPDFPSDANPMKDVARDMMRMTWQINTETLPAIEGLQEADGMQVTCYTCHRGATHPATSAPAEGEAAPAERDRNEHPHGDHGSDG